MYKMHGVWNNADGEVEVHLLLWVDLLGNLRVSLVKISGDLEGSEN